MPDDIYKLPEPRKTSGDHVALDQHAPGALVDGPDTGTADAGHGGTVADEDPRGSRRKRHPLRTALSVLAAAVVASAAGLAATGVLGGSGHQNNAAAPTVHSTAQVQRTTLTNTQKVTGRLGYGDVSSVISGSGPGLITWVPKAGAVITRGNNVYSVNQQKTPLLYGNIPIYRTLKPGDSGSDVKILEQNLEALGYYDSADSYYSDATAAAVKEWQGDLNRKKTGTVKPGDAVVVDGPRKVSDVKAQVGAPAPTGGPVLSWTGTERVVTVDLDAQYQDLVRIGTKAKVELPDNSTVEATVTDIGTPSNAGSSGSTSSSTTTTLPVKLKVNDQKGLGNYEAASVKVYLESQTHQNVLAVPISALVARNGGGYALQVVKSSASNSVEYVPVKLGMFSDSMVEVSGAGITEGTVVEVPK